MSRPRILVVEDDDFVREFVAMVFRLKDYTVDTAVNGREGLALLDQHRYDLVVCNMGMPELDGPGLYQEVMQRGAGAAPPFLFITGDHEKPDYIWFFQGAKVPSLAKPFSETALSQAVERILGGWPLSA
jgi:CheY-like chemotaxis protein